MVWCSCSDASAGDVGTFCLVASQRTDPGDITAIDGLESARCRIARNAHPQLLRFACGKSGRGTRQKRLKTAETPRAQLDCLSGLPPPSHRSSIFNIPIPFSHPPIPVLLPGLRHRARLAGSRLPPGFHRKHKHEPPALPSSLQARRDVKENPRVSPVIRRREHAAPRLRH